jgi:lysophospholipase L1-like esterase
MENKSLMWFWIAGGVAVLMLIVVLWFWFGTALPVTNYPPRDGGIVAFGDSLVFGAGATKGHDFVSVLSEMIGEPIENRGVSGDTTAMGLLRLDTVVDQHPRIVLLLLGGNDYLRQIPREQTFRNLEMIITRLEKDGAIVLLLGVRGGLVVDHFDTDFAALAKRTGAAYVPDVLDGLLGEAQFMSDGIHPNDAGYRLIAEKVFPVLFGVLR